MTQRRVIQGSFLPRGPQPACAPRLPGKGGAVQGRMEGISHGATRAIPVDPSQIAFTPTRGRPLPEAVQQKMSQAFNADFSHVRIHEGPQAAALGAIALTMGSDIFFAPGHYQPETTRGQQLIGHELAHVLQQSSGRVRNPLPNGPAIIQDFALEAEADRLGHAAASLLQPRPSTPVQAKPAGSRLAPPARAIPAARPVTIGPPPAGAIAPPTIMRWRNGRGAMRIWQRKAVPGWQPRTVIQRDIENETLAPSSPDATAIQKFFTSYNTAAQNAYNFVVTVPSLGAYAGLDGRTAKWARDWDDHLNGRRPGLLAASFGYAIESLVSDPNSSYCPGAPVGYSVLTQVVSGGTRPDLVLVKKGQTSHAAWADLTAANSVDHIFTKDGWSSKVNNFAEITYPSLDLATLALMKQNAGNTGPISQKEFKKRMKAAQLEYEKNKKLWTDFGDAVTGLANIEKQNYSREMLALFPGTKQGIIEAILINKLSLTSLDKKLVPSILAAIGINPTSWGYTTGTSMSVKAGEAWLIDNFA